MEINNKIAKKLKEDFPIFKHNLGLIYLDNAATSQRPSVVINAVKDFAERDNANVGRGVYTLAERAMKKYGQARAAIANFIGSDSEEIIFTRNTTESINILAYTLPSIIPKGKNEILISEMEHHSNIVPWQQLAKKQGFKLKYVKVDSNFTLDMNDFNSKLSNKTAIVSICHVSNVLGTLNPIKEITKLAKSKGAITIIDAAQSLQHIPINVKEINCDFLVFSGHKVLGPNGVGILFGKKELLEKLPPFNFGGGMISKVTKEYAEWAKIPEKFEAGTQNIAEAIGLAQSFGYLNKIGLEEIANWEKKLTSYALSRLNEVPKIIIYHPKNNNTPIISFNLPGIHPHDVAGLLNEKKIAIRAGHCCAMPLMEIIKAKGGVCRASFSFYNTLEDIDLLVDSLKEIKEKFD
jgi:cysteine desulfurase/selenocysteine lyase